MILKQYYLGCLAHASYLVADERSRVAVVVDPQRDVDEYVEDAHRLGCRIEHVFLTHFHADFVAGHLELRDREGARIYLGAGAEAEYGFIPLADGEGLALGRVRLEVVETPGHSPESISILVYDLEASVAGSRQTRPSRARARDRTRYGPRPLPLERGERLGPARRGRRRTGATRSLSRARARDAA
jgi:glyoxylase-like metal-dependent hydrolase (beta-lactamase superfamily II)